MANENACQLTGGGNKFVECDGGDAELQVPSLNAPIPSGCNDSILVHSKVGGGTGHLKSCGLSLDSSDGLEAFSDTVVRRIHFKKLGSVVGERRKGISKKAIDDVKGSSSRMSTSVLKPRHSSTRSEEPGEGKDAATSQDDINSGEKKSMSKSSISGGDSIDSRRDCKEVSRLVHCRSRPLLLY